MATQERFISYLTREASSYVQRELRGSAALKPFVREVPVKTHAHGDALFPQVDQEHGAEHFGFELRAVQEREGEEYRQLQEPDGVE